MPYQLVRVAPDPNAVPFSPIAWLNGHKTYIVLAVAAAKLWYTAIYGKPWADNVDTAVNETLALLGVGALRSALKASTAQVVNATVRPSSPAAQAQAATVPNPPKEISQ
jgi:hypothetical protein